MIMIYFLKYNIKYSFIILIIIISYLLLLNKGIIEGNDMDYAKRELKYMEMANIDRLLENLVSVFENINDDCEGSYTKYGPCDKKCGESYKYKTYRITNRGGIKGNKCIQEDGFTKKKKCDSSDYVFKCNIGEPCESGIDCNSGSCDPRSKSCLTTKVCSRENLNLCNTEFKCIDLNNQYGYNDKIFKYDNNECTLENNDENNNENDNENSGIDINDYQPNEDGIINMPTEFNCEDIGWYMQETEESIDNPFLHECRSIGNNTVYLEGDSLLERQRQYGLDNLDEGLYCKFGYKSSGEEDIGYKTPYTSQDQISEDMCNEILNNNYTIETTELMPGNEEVLCIEGNWPPLSYFKESNSSQNVRINIDELCGRCRNGYRYFSDGICENCSDGNDIVRNQYRINGYEYEGYNLLPVGKNTVCAENDPIALDSNLVCPDSVNCGVYAENSDACSGGNPDNGSCNGCCLQCNPGYEYDHNSDSCVECGDNTFSSTPGINCTPCPEDIPFLSDDRTSCNNMGNWCDLNLCKNGSICKNLNSDGTITDNNGNDPGVDVSCDCVNINNGLDTYVGEFCDYRIVGVNWNSGQQDMRGCNYDDNNSPETDPTLSECEDLFNYENNQDQDIIGNMNLDRGHMGGCYVCMSGDRCVGGVTVNNTTYYYNTNTATARLTGGTSTIDGRGGEHQRVICKSDTE